MTHRTFLTALFFSVFVFNAQAQWSAGISGGTNMTFVQWYFSNLGFDLGYDPAMGWRAAANVEYRFSPAIGLRAEIANQVFRNKLKVEMVDVNDPEGNGNYYRVPFVYNTTGGSLLVKFSPLRAEREFYVMAGPGYAYITHAWQRLAPEMVEGQGISRKQRIDLDDTYRVHWLADVGMGYTHSLKEKHHLFLELRYQYVLTKFSKSEIVNTRVQSVLLNLGYLYSL